MVIKNLGICRVKALPYQLYHTEREREREGERERVADVC